MDKFLKIIASVFVVAALTACGGEGDAEEAQMRPGSVPLVPNSDTTQDAARPVVNLATSQSVLKGGTLVNLSATHTGDSADTGQRLDVDWGDGTAPTQADQASSSHTYTQAGTYTIKAKVTLSNRVIEGQTSVTISAATTPTARASQDKLKVGEQVSLWVEHLYDDVTKVTWKLGAGMDDIPSEVVARSSKKISVSFKTAGRRQVTAEIYNSTGPVETKTVDLEVAPGPVTATATITAVQDTSGISIADGAETQDTRPTLKGTVSAGSDLPLYSVQVYDGSENIGQAEVTGDSWVYQPTTALSLGEHAFTVLVRRTDDGVEGKSSEVWKVRVKVMPTAQAADGTQDAARPVVNLATSQSVLKGGTLVNLSATHTGDSADTVQRLDVDWGDGTAPTQADQASSSHTYTQAGTYTIKAQVSTLSNRVIEGQTSVTISAATTPTARASQDKLKVGEQVSLWVEHLYDDVTKVTWKLGAGMDDIPSEVVARSSKKISVSFKTAGRRQVTAEIYNSTGPVETKTVDLEVAPGPVTATATITAVQDTSGISIADGAETQDTRPTLKGTVSAGSDLPLYSVQVYDGSENIGQAEVTGDSWVYQPTTALSLGEHAFTVLVRRTDDGVEGKSSEVWKVRVKVMPTAQASKTNPSVGEEILLWVENLYDDVVKVIWKFVGTDMADISSDVVDRVSRKISVFFKTGGKREVTAEIHNSSGMVDTKTMTLEVALGSVNATATITAVQDTSGATIADGAETQDTRPTLKGAVSEVLGPFHNVQVYNGDKNIGQAKVTGTSWVYTPASALNSGDYEFKVLVGRGDGMVGTSSKAWRVKLRLKVTGKLNDTGQTADQCYTILGSDTLGACSGAAEALGVQDGHVVVAMSFSPVGPYPLTDCVQDNTTGLMWEGKPASGTRGKPEMDPNGQYTNYSTEEEAKAPLINATAYVKAVNAAGLCGHDDWRLPSVYELQGIVDYGRKSPPSIDTNSFLNMPSEDKATPFWSATRVKGRGGAYLARGVDFLHGDLQTYVHGQSRVRLVRP